MYERLGVGSNKAIQILKEISKGLFIIIYYLLLVFNSIILNNIIYIFFAVIWQFKIILKIYNNK